MKKLTLFGFSSLPLSTFIVKIFVVFALTCAFTVQIIAQSPKISIQGTLKTADGNTVVDGTYNVTFRLYNVETGGTPLWFENATVDVIGGIYSHYLGSGTALNVADFATTLYMGVKVGNYELTPRTELSYSPYSFTTYSTVCSGAVGDIKHSILNPTQFAAVNGACWVPMDGRALASTDQLRVITGMLSVPDGSGLFLRSQEFSGGADNDPSRTSASAIATLQGEAVQLHNHGVNDPGHAHNYDDSNREQGGTSYFIAGGERFSGPITSSNQLTQFNTTGISIQNAGGPETRPKNLNFWVYIRIN
ncbi:MAG: hypothetical protein Q7T20_04240 [Saprospiraceae bacterium]|nr:hypothetical protein [Saprospiraceae bacterium]